MQHPSPSINSYKDDWQLKSRCDSGLHCRPLLPPLLYKLAVCWLHCSLKKDILFIPLHFCIYFAYIFGKNIYIFLYIFIPNHKFHQLAHANLCLNNFLATVKFSVPVYTKCNLSTIRKKKKLMVVNTKERLSKCQKINFLQKP